MIEAQHRNEESISVRDILVALTRISASPTPETTRLHGLAVALRASVGIPHLPITSRPYTSKSDIPLSGESKKVLLLALREADEDWQYWIDNDHLLRGLLAFPNEARDALLRFGLDLDSVRHSSRVHRREFPAERPPKWARSKILLSRLERLSNRYPYLASLVLTFLAIFICAVALLVVLKLRGPI